MKKNLMKKVFAVTLSVAMACSIIPATNPVTASAATAVKLNTKFKTLKIGAKYKLTLNKNTWKVVKATSKAPSIAKVYKTTAKAVKVKGKSEGRTNVVVKVKKNKTTKKLKCKFSVVEATSPSPSTPTPTPGPDVTEKQTKATVKNQEELDKALADSNITEITIQTNEATTFETKKESYAQVDLIVDAQNASVVNNATFRNIDIQAIADHTWTENAVGNTIRVLAKLARIIVGKDAVVNNISFTGADANIELRVEGGEVKGVSVGAKLSLNITGESAKAIPVTVTAGAKDAEVSSEVPVNVTANADLKLNLSKGAENSTVTFGAADVKVALDNQTDSTVEVTKFNGDKQTANRGKTDLTSPSTGTTPSGSSGTTTTPSGNKAANPYGIPNVERVYLRSASIRVISGSASVISGGSLTFTVTGASITSNAAIECQAVVTAGSSGKTTLPYKTCTNGATFTVPSFYGLALGDHIKVELTFRAQATTVYAAGDASEVVTCYITPNGQIYFTSEGEIDTRYNTFDRVAAPGRDIYVYNYIPSTTD